MDYETRQTADGEICPVDGNTVVDFASAKQSRADKKADEAKRRADELAAEAESQAEARQQMIAELKARIRGELLRRHDLNYVASTDCWWRYDGEVDTWTPLKERAVRMFEPGHMFDKLYWALFLSVMHDDNRHFQTVTSSFREQPPGVLNMLRPRFCPLSDRSDYDPFFDMLLYSLGNGEEAAIRHIEQLVLAKHQHPENYLLPALALHNEKGGAGKNLFAEVLLATVFGRNLVADGLSMRDVTHNFNSHLIGKAIWYIDESVDDKCDDNALKRLLGSRSHWIEPKGIAKFQVDSTALLIIAGNGVSGSVRVANSEVDRRISIIEPKRTLKSVVAETRKCTEVEAETWVRERGQHILRDHQQVGRWLRALTERHGDLNHVSAFHGDAYRALVAAQRPFHDILFDAVFKDEAFQYIRRPHLYDAYRELAKSQNNGYGVVGNRKFYRHLESWCEREGISLETKKVHWQPSQYAKPTTTVDVVYRVDRMEPPASLVNNDEAFGGFGSGWDIAI